MDKTFTSFKMEERSYVSYIKREIHNRIARANFTSSQAGEIDIIVSELTSNIIKHAGRGELLLRVQNLDRRTSLCEIITIDSGPGMADTTRMLKDGISTTQTLGQGLGAIMRLSTISQLYSIPGWGTVQYSMVRTKNKDYVPPVIEELEIRALCVNKPHEKVCGDGFAVKVTDSEIAIFFGDGLGHGIRAKEAFDAAADCFMETNETDPVDIIRFVHQNIRKTRGLVGVVMVCDLQAREWRLCGVGNILSRMYVGVEFKTYMSYNGTIGMTIPNSMSMTTSPMEVNQHLIMCTDGIQNRWDLTRYPSILKFDNIILAAAIYKDYTRGNDDSSILIAKVL